MLTCPCGHKWRMEIRRQANALDSRANTRAVEPLNGGRVEYCSTPRTLRGAAGTTDTCAARGDSGSETRLRSDAHLGRDFHRRRRSRSSDLDAQGVRCRLPYAGIRVFNGLCYTLYIRAISLWFTVIQRGTSGGALWGMDRMFRCGGSIGKVSEARTRSLSVGSRSARLRARRFSYDPRRQIRHDVSFTIPAGGKVAVVGASGSGKSTLARLLYRFYDVAAGAIRINGIDIRDLRQTSLRGAIAIVPQDTVLFNDTVYYNIQYGRPEATREE